MKEVNKWLSSNNDYDPAAVEIEGVAYIAGPMRGYPNLNFDAFHKAEKKLKEDGYVVLNPAHTPLGLKSPKAYIMIDLAMLFECDTIYMLKGWEESKGARLEHSLAEFLGLNIYYEKENYGSSSIY